MIREKIDAITLWFISADAEVYFSFAGVYFPLAGGLFRPGF